MYSRMAIRFVVYLTLIDGTGECINRSMLLDLLVVGADQLPYPDARCEIIERRGAVG